MEITVEVVEALAKILTSHKLDSLKVGELELVKSKHEAPGPKSPGKTKSVTQVDSDELLYWSSQSPKKFHPNEEKAIAEAMSEADEETRASRGK